MFPCNGYSLVGADLDKWNNTISKLARDLPQVMNQSSAGFVAVQGTSGLAAAFALRERLGDDVRFVIVRKPDEKSHSCNIFAIGESFEASIPRFVFLDDLVDSGATVERVATALWGYECASILTYNGKRDTIRDDGVFLSRITLELNVWDDKKGTTCSKLQHKQIAARRWKYS